MNIGVMGGTFDPIHIGHLVAAEDARVTLNLDEVLFIPAGQPWLKNERNILPVMYRIEMVRRAISGNEYFKISTLEADRTGNSYSVDTMEALRRIYGTATNIFFIIGQDSLQLFHKWKNPVRLVELCQLVVMNRPQVPPLDIAVLEKSVPGITRRIIQLHIPEIGISSTDIRERIACGRSISYLVPTHVEEYIREHGLYQS